MSMQRNFTVLVMCLFFAGACAMQTKTVPSVGAGPGTVIGTDAGSVKEGAAVGSPGGKNIGHAIDSLEQELQRTLAVSETISFKRQQDMLVLTCRSDSMFGFDSVVMNSGAQAAIRRIADVLISYPQTRIRIEGHTDSIGPAASNQKLSERRADAVKKELIVRKLQADRIEIVGFGAARPVASNKIPDGRRQNRRIQIFIIAAPERS
jgi:outer membrane protein OmpA-like peptidoglycan-associated protein